MSRHCCVISKQHVPDEIFADLCLALRRARLKSLSSELVRKYIPSVVVSNTCFSNMPKKLPKSIGAMTQPCLTPQRISNVSEKLPLICTVPFLSVWKDSIMLCNLGGQPIFGRTLTLCLPKTEISVFQRPTLACQRRRFPSL